MVSSTLLSLPTRGFVLSSFPNCMTLEWEELMTFWDHSPVIYRLPIVFPLRHLVYFLLSQLGGNRAFTLQADFDFYFCDVVPEFPVSSKHFLIFCKSRFFNRAFRTVLRDISLFERLHGIC